VDRANDREVPAIECCDLDDAQSLGGRHHRCIDRPERQVSILGDELGDPDPVADVNRFRDQVPRCQVTEESDLSLNANSGLQQVRYLGYDELRDDEWPRMARQQREAGSVVSIVFVDVCVERAGIDDQRDRRASRRKISSIRRAVSRRPLRPAFAAIRRRRPAPRWDSMASRVISDTVVPRRSASWRSRASSSSDNFTVVRRMVCQHTCAPRSTSSSSGNSRVGSF
jgi:hypothetical protein